MIIVTCPHCGSDIEVRMVLTSARFTCNGCNGRYVLRTQAGYVYASKPTEEDQSKPAWIGSANRER
jgi:transposase-like protein